MDFRNVGLGLNAVGTSLRGGDGMALVEREQRKANIEALMDRMGIAGPKRDVLATLPTEQQAPILWDMVNPQPYQPDGEVINGQLVDLNTGQVMGNYNPEPLDLSGLGIGQGQDMGLDWTGLAIGGATRSDSFTGMTPRMQVGLHSMLGAAQQELGPGLQVYSGYRSPELQAKLYADAVSKYGSEAEARKWVAPPGRSRHNTGQAADLKWNGQRLDQAPRHVQKWVKQNAARFGLDVPMEWEPWQVEIAGARGQQVGTSKLDQQIQWITRALATGGGTPAQRDGLETMLGQLNKERDRLAPPETPASIQALEYRAEAAGLTPGTPEYAQFMVNGGRGGGFIVETTPEGGVRVAQGAAATGNPKFNEVESKTNIYYTRAKGALEVLEPRAGELTNPVMRAVENDPTGLARGAVQSDDFQVAKNAGDEFLQAILRKDTGAAITVPEQYLYGRTYLPQPGDSEAVLQAKSQARKRALAALQSGMSASQMLAAERALNPDLVPETAEVGGMTFEQFSQQQSAIDAAEKYGVTLEEMWEMRGE